jgi:NTE family protein
MAGALDADLVLEGGGVKGIALAGAISVLQDRGYRFHKVAGTSAGAIVGALVAAETPHARLREMMRDLDYRRFQDPPLLGRLGPPGAVVQVLLRKGWCRGDYLRSWIGDMLGERDVRTFADLRSADEGADAALERDPDRDYRFVAMASDLTQGRLVRLPWAYRERFGLEPDGMPVADAVRASMAIPYFFVPARCPDQLNGGRAWLVDGGMLSNFSVDVFDRTDGREPRWPTFGIKLSAKGAPAVTDVRGIVSLSRAMLSTMTGFYDRMHVNRPDVIGRTIFVDTSGVRATDFDLTRDTAERLFESGRTAADRFLNAWDFEEHKKARQRSPAPRADLAEAT